jgi:hypothetical protein
VDFHVNSIFLTFSCKLITLSNYILLASFKFYLLLMTGFKILGKNCNPIILIIELPKNPNFLAHPNTRKMNLVLPDESAWNEEWEPAEVFL